MVTLLPLFHEQTSHATEPSFTLKDQWGILPSQVISLRLNTLCSGEHNGDESREQSGDTWTHNSAWLYQRLLPFHYASFNKKILVCFRRFSRCSTVCSLSRKNQLLVIDDLCTTLPLEKQSLSRSLGGVFGLKEEPQVRLSLDGR